MEQSPEEQVREARDAFVAELRRWRDVAGLSQRSLADKVDYTPSYVSKVENGVILPSREFAEAADRACNAGRALTRSWRELNEVAGRTAPAPRHQEPQPQTAAADPATTLVVEHELALLRYADGFFITTIRRELRNVGTEPVTRYLIRIAVDRYPGDPERSNRLYRESPLTWEEIDLTATCRDEPMRWVAQHDRDAFKEVWLLFENEDGRYPLYPGEATWIEYRYRVSAGKWGPWWQRAIRLPTRRLQMRLDFPSAIQPAAWGMETSMSADASSFRNPIIREQAGDRTLFTWSTVDPPLHARYRIEWKFRNPAPEATVEKTPSPSQQMAAIGVVQAGEPILDEVARPLRLPDEAEDLRRVVTELSGAIERIGQVHTFSKGMGLAAPQIGIGRAVALVRTPDGETITLVNPRVIDESAQTDEQYEGCLSFFDVRGMVPRPLAIEVEHQDIEGNVRITRFTEGVARLVYHEIDHLHGRDYRSRMRSGINPIPVAQYKGTGQSWSYSQG